MGEEEVSTHQSSKDLFEGLIQPLPQASVIWGEEEVGTTPSSEVLFEGLIHPLPKASLIWGEEDISLLPMGVSLHQIQIQVLFQKMGDFVCVFIYFIGDRYATLTFLVIKII